MIIIRMQGGLGNQLFQYALYLQLKELGREVRMDVVSGYEGDRQRRPVLPELFGVSYEVAGQAEVDRLRDAEMSPLCRIRRKLLGRRSLEWEEPDGDFHPEVLSLEEAYLNGYFQSERYFPDAGVRRSLRETFGTAGGAASVPSDGTIPSRDLPSHLRTQDHDGIKDSCGSGAQVACEKVEDAVPGATVQSMTEQLRADILAAGEGSVSLHMRRGDYLRPGTAETHGGICTEAYYQRAVGRICEALRGRRISFYLFSDDPAYAERFAEALAREREEARFVAVRPEGSGDRQAASELTLMSACAHHILANSSFSWWGAWLSEPREGRLTIAPDRWYNNRSAEGIYTERMIRLSGSAEDR